MMNIYSIATKTKSIATKCRIETEEEFAPVYQARPGMKLPAIIMINGTPQLVSAMWGLRSTISANTIHMSRILKSRTWNLRLRRQRCVIPANCFIAEKNGQAWLIRLPQYRMFLMGAVYQKKGNEYHFTLLETESPDLITSVTEDMPVVFPADKMQKWFTVKELDRILHFADKAANEYFDYFRVDATILNGNVNDKELLRPTGMTLEQYKLREMQIKAVTFEKERMNRRGGK
jgi:putative SOS response-associated peptidase YedK